MLAHLPQRSDEEELAYTAQKIEDNFSNYSAWHQRSLLLLRINKDSASLAAALRSGESTSNNRARRTSTNKQTHAA